MSDTNNTFKIGLCMAGAISGGAYTAGAIDFLLEALEDWQRRKDNKEPNTPSHNIQISVIGGASAGGMTGVIAASAIQNEIEPVRKLDGDILATKPNNKFYNSWVDILSNDMLSILLNTSDITKEKGLESLLNSDFIDTIADKAINISEKNVISRKYISENLKIFVTLSNLEGINFSVSFKSNSQKHSRYVINSHNDYACFKLCNNEQDYTNDGWIPLNFKTKLNTEIAKNAAMATGAFPMGLKARKISRSINYMNDLEWLFHITKAAQNPFNDEPYNTVNVDGGLINNEPFDKIRELLMKEMPISDPEDFQDYNKFKSTILMIDPFPSEQIAFDKNTNLSTIFENTIEAMLGQARIKPSVLIDAMDSKKAGQFLIAPVRHEKIDNFKKTIEGKRAIACGSLNGFGGFISKEFRIHDYFLGRANCEKFLRDHFTVPANNTNEIFVTGYSGIINKSQFTSMTDHGLQIIPIFTERQSEPYMPTFSNRKQWPSVTRNYISSYRKLIAARIEKLLLNFTNYSIIDKMLLWLGAKVLLNRKISNTLIDKIIESLEDHKLLK